MGDHAEQTRRLIAQEEEAIALRLKALEQMKASLAELERLAAEAESVEEDK